MFCQCGLLWYLCLDAPVHLSHLWLGDTDLCTLFIEQHALVTQSDFGTHFVAQTMAGLFYDSTFCSETSPPHFLFSFPHTHLLRLICPLSLC